MNCFTAHDCSTPTGEKDDNNEESTKETDTKPRLNAILSDVKQLAEDIGEIENDIEELIHELH